MTQRRPRKETSKPIISKRNIPLITVRQEHDHAHPHTNIYTRAYKHTYTHVTHIHQYTHTHIYIYTNTRIHTYFAYTNAHIHTYSRRQAAAQIYWSVFIIIVLTIFFIFC